MGTIPWAASTSGCLRPPPPTPTPTRAPAGSPRWRQRRSIAVKFFIFLKKSHLSTYSFSVGFRGGEGRPARTRQELGSMTPPPLTGTQPSELWAEPPWLPEQSKREHPRMEFPSQGGRRSGAAAQGFLGEFLRLRTDASSTDNCHLEYRSMEASFGHILLSIALNTGILET